MLDILSTGFQKASDKLRGITVLTADNISSSLEDIRKSLLEADVGYDVAKNFLSRVQEKAIGHEVKVKAGKGADKIKVSAGDHFVGICKKELEDLMGPDNSELKYSSVRPTVIMMLGLQGTGKTTTSAKLARYLVRKKKKKPLLVACDIYRPAAAQQLKILGQKTNIPVFHVENEKPLEICKQAIRHAYNNGHDVIILDTAGRLTIDTVLMSELKEIKEFTKPENTLLVCDAMMGQDAVTTAKAFNDELDLSGYIMTKLDGDTRGGAALSIKEITGKPIKFLGMGEGVDTIEEFRSEGLASRILGMGDVVSLMEDFERVADIDAEKDAEKLLSGQFNFKDFYKQISMIQKMGSLKDLIAKLPMQNMIPAGANISDGEFVKVKAMIDSMTEKERINPDLLKTGSRVQRIARGSGRSVQEVQGLITKFKQMRLMMGNMGGLMSRLSGMGGGGAPSSPEDLARLLSKKTSKSGTESFSNQIRKVDRDKIKKLRRATKNKQKKRKR
jgi:signal recognition particle subunit SRP54